MENVEQRIKKIVAEQLGVNEAEVKNESSFVDDLGADSLDTVELVMALEEEFECEIPDEAGRKNKYRSAGHRLHKFPHQLICYLEQISPLFGVTLSKRRVVVTGLRHNFACR